MKRIETRDVQDARRREERDACIREVIYRRWDLIDGKYVENHGFATPWVVIPWTGAVEFVEVT